MKYPVSKELDLALSVLFEDKNRGLSHVGALSKVLPPEMYEEPHGGSAEEKIVHIRKRLEGFVVLMAEEAQEYGDPEQSERLSDEATGLLLALRELFSHFPDYFD